MKAILDENCSGSSGDPEKAKMLINCAFFWNPTLLTNAPQCYKDSRFKNGSVIVAESKMIGQ